MSAVGSEPLSHPWGPPLLWLTPCFRAPRARRLESPSRMLCVVYRGKAPPCLGAPDLVGGTSKSSRRMEGWDARLGAATGNAGN